MGNHLDKLGGYADSEESQSPERIVDDILTPSTSGTIRKRKADQKESDSPTISKKVTKLDTAKYVYEKLFKQGEGSDITIHAVGRVWNLHKFYLQQCSYFEVLLNGSWKESTENSIHLDVKDENVTQEGMEAVLASLYLNEIEIDLEKIEGTLAAAILLGLDSVVNRCEETMIENLAHNNVLRLHDIAERYGLVQVQKTALFSLKMLFWKFMKDREMLRDLSESLFNRLLSSSELLLVEGEMDLYKMVKSWIYIQENPSSLNMYDLDDQQFDRTISEFCRNSPTNYLFLKYASLFSPLRIHHFLTSTASIRLIEFDRLIPHEIVTSVSIEQWRSLLRTEENPLLINDLTEDNFNLNALRLGRVINKFPKCWRWTGFNFGVDLLLHITSYSLTMKRNCLNQSTPYSISLKAERKIHYRIIMADENGKCFFDSQKTEVSLRPDQSVVIMRLPEDITLPISIHVQYLAVDPPQPSLIFVNDFVRRHNNTNVL